jgi:SNF family Na+-dependent transporter
LKEKTDLIKSAFVAAGIDMTMLLCILVSVVHLIILATNNVKQLNTLLFTSFKNIFSDITQTFNQ